MSNWASLENINAGVCFQRITILSNICNEAFLQKYWGLVSKFTSHIKRIRANYLTFANPVIIRTEVINSLKFA